MLHPSAGGKHVHRRRGKCMQNACCALHGVTHEAQPSRMWVKSDYLTARRKWLSATTYPAWKRGSPRKNNPDPAELMLSNVFAASRRIKLLVVFGTSHQMDELLILERPDWLART
jgi:hypothetical protein